jgi:drug/metabolite transporter (DMT)-like permease
MSGISWMALLFIALTIVWTVAGQLLVKKGMQEVGSAPGQAQMLPAFLWRAITQWKVLLGVACAVLATLCWMVALSRAQLSFAYPFFGLAIVLVLVLSGLMLGERVPVTRWIGVAIVFVGIFVASR